MNPLLAKRIFAERNSQEIMYMLWEDCVPISFFRSIYHLENFIYLNGNNVLYPKTEEIVLKHVTETQNNYNKMQSFFEKHHKVFQYVCATLFLKFNTRNNPRGINMRGNFVLNFKEWPDLRKKKRIQVKTWKVKAVLTKRRKAYVNTIGSLATVLSLTTV